MAQKTIQEATAKSRAAKKAKEVDTMKGVEHWAIDKPKPYKLNAKNHPAAQIELLARIIQKHGFDQPIVVDTKGVIVKGHGRLLAARKLKMETVPVVVRHFTPGEAAEARIADNRLAEFGWDFQTLVADVMEGLQHGLDIDVTGFTLKELGLDQVAGATAGVPNDKALDTKEAWAGMPEFNQEDLTAFKSVIVNFNSEESLAAFAKLMGQSVGLSTRSIWFPKEEPEWGMTTEKRYDAEAKKGAKK